MLASYMDELNQTHAEHAAVALAVQAVATLLAWPLFGLVPAVVWLCALPGSFLFFGREHAQAEQRLYTRYKATFLSWGITMEAMRFWEWDKDSQLDAICPALANIVAGGALWLTCC